MTIDETRSRTPALRGRLPVMAALAAIAILLSDTAHRLHVQAPLSVVALAFACLVLARGVSVRGYTGAPESKLGPRVDAARMPPVPLSLFIAWAGLDTVGKQHSLATIQNLIVYMVFILAIPATALATARGTPKRVMNSYTLAGVVSAAIYLATVVVAGPGNSLIYGDRAIAGSLLIAIVVSISSIAVLRTSLWPLVLMFLAVATSLSRAATAVTLILMVTLTLRGKPGVALVKAVMYVGGGILSVFLAYMYWSPFRARFVQGDGYAVGGITVGSSGRTQLWSVVFNHWKIHPWTGYGAGSSETYTTQQFVTISHPHDDYLRLLHDFGIVGLFLFLLAMFSLLHASIHRYRASSGTDKALHLAAALGILQLLLSMIANNPLASVFGMLALGAILGASRARSLTPVDKLANRDQGNCATG